MSVLASTRHAAPRPAPRARGSSPPRDGTSPFSFRFGGRARDPPSNDVRSFARGGRRFRRERAWRRLGRRRRRPRPTCAGPPNAARRHPRRTKGSLEALHRSRDGVHVGTFDVPKAWTFSRTVACEFTLIYAGKGRAPLASTRGQEGGGRRRRRDDISRRGRGEGVARVGEEAMPRARTTRGVEGRVEDEDGRVRDGAEAARRGRPDAPGGEDTARLRGAARVAVHRREEESGADRGRGRARGTAEDEGARGAGWRIDAWQVSKGDFQF